LFTAHAGYSTRNGYFLLRTVTYDYDFFQVLCVFLEGYIDGCLISYGNVL